MASLAAMAGLWAIDAYQRRISPRKGFCCALHACTGGPTCSVFGKATIREYGLLPALPRIRQRLILCSEYATDPTKGKINEDDPGPLTSEECGGCFKAFACGSALLADPLFWLGS